MADERGGGFELGRISERLNNQDKALERIEKAQAALGERVDDAREKTAQELADLRSDVNLLQDQGKGRALRTAALTAIAASVPTALLMLWNLLKG